MRLTGPVLEVTLILLALVLPVALVLLWRRLPGGIWRVVTSLVLVLVCQAVAIAAAGVYANNKFGFYNSWGDLMGVGKGGSQVPTANTLTPPDHSQGSVVTLAVPIPSVVRGPHKTKNLSVLVWLPKQYQQPQYRTTRFPVTLMMPGQPGTPQGVFKQYDFARQATQAIDNHRVAPFVAVFPPLMVAPPRDTECADVTGGPQAETWLTKSVREAVLKHLRVTPDGRRWSAMGWSTGGFCAAKLLVRHPTLFHAAVGFGAYYDAETDHTTGALYTNRQQRNANSPIWLVQRNTTIPRRLLIIVSRQDRASYAGRFYADSKAMIEATRGVPGVATVVLPQGGHNYRVYRPTLSTALVWLGRNGAL